MSYLRKKGACLLAAVLCGGLLHAQEPVEDRIFAVTASGGMATISSALARQDRPVFGLAQNGMFAALSGRCAINRSWGIGGELSLQAHPYHAEKAAEMILENDIMAVSAKVDATPYIIFTAAAGPYCDIRLLPAFHINIAALFGVTSVSTPHIVHDVKTAPYTRTEYKRGHASAFYTGATVRPTWYFTPRLGAGLVGGMGYARPEVQMNRAYSLEYLTFRAGLEVIFRI